jgi:hypothetical protein
MTRRQLASTQQQRRRANVCAAACAAIAIALPRAATAQPRVEVPPDCGSERELYDELERLVGQDANAALPLHLRISAPDGAGMHTLRLEMQGESRVLQDRDCRALWKSAIVMCAVRVRPDLAIPDDSAKNEPAATKAAAPAHTDERGEPAPWHGSAGIGGGAVIGFLPELAPLLELDGSVERGRFGATVALRLATATEARTDDGRGARLHAIGGRLAFLVAPWPIARFQAGIELLRVSGEGLGSDATLTDAAWSLAPFIEGALRPLRLSHVWLEVGVAGAWAVLRPRFEILDYGVVYRVPRFGGSAVLRLGWEFH